MIIDIYNELLTRLTIDLPTVNVCTTFDPTDLDYPILVISERSNLADPSTKDSAGYKYDNQMYQLDIFTMGENKRTTAMDIRKNIDSIFADDYGMERIFSDEVPNFLDRNIYRYTLRYSFSISKDNIIYRG